nr:unnamed protein product [Callosobruchus chinensis]
MEIDIQEFAKYIIPNFFKESDATEMEII